MLSIVEVEVWRALVASESLRVCSYDAGTRSIPSWPGDLDGPDRTGLAMRVAAEGW